MNVPVGDGGVSRRDHLKQVQAWSELEPPVEFPELLSHVWVSFIELHNARASGGMGPSSITYEAIESWMRVTGSILLPWEVEAIKRLDMTWLKVNREARPNSDTTGRNVKSKNTRGKR